MAEAVEYRGLCSTCKNAPHCTFPRDPQKPVFQCERFESEEPSPMRAAARDESAASRSHATQGSGSTRFLGLCSNCEKRETCRLPKPEGGVWDCEEYR